MAEELTLHERIARGQRAERLTEELGEHIRAVEAKYHDEWARAKTPEAREFLWVKLQALTDVVRDIAHDLSDGQLAAQQQEYDNGPQ